jgi:FkbM family methyltransferase
MALPRSPYRPIFRPLHRPVLAGLQTLRLAKLSRKWIRVSNPDYPWPLPGLLSGMVMLMTRREDFQYLEPNYEPRVAGAIQQLVRPGFVCADVGAHVGYMTLLMARLAGDAGRVVALEALPENAALLRRHVELNQLAGRVQVENVAVSDADLPAITLHRGPSSFESSAVSSTPFGQFTVPARTLDQAFASADRLDFVKMDIEGAEALAMRGMRRVLRALRPTVLLEVHDDGWPAIDELLAAGYELHDLDFQPTDAATMRRRGLTHCIARATSPENLAAR